MKELILKDQKRICTYDQVFDFSYKQAICEFAQNSFFKIGWADSVNLDKSSVRYLHSEYSNDDLQRINIIEKISQSPAAKELEGYQVTKCVLNLSTPSDSHYAHTHREDKIFLYYVNLEWQDGWHGETLFYNNELNEIVYASPYTPGRVIVFDAKIPHTIRPQSHKATQYRFTLAILLNKCY